MQLFKTKDPIVHLHVPFVSCERHHNFRLTATDSSHLSMKAIHIAQGRIAQRNEVPTEHKIHVAKRWVPDLRDWCWISRQGT
jgi:hypothetical protein